MYVYDDTYSECSYSGLLAEAYDFAEDHEDDLYSCFSGDNCDGLSCAVTFGDMTLRTTLSSFFDTCVESNVGVTSFPSISPKAGTESTKSTFEASWARLFGSEAAKDACLSDSPVVTITCGNGASIFYINSTDPAMVCTNSNATHLTCIGNADVSTNNFINVVYVSSLSMPVQCEHFYTKLTLRFIFYTRNVLDLQHQPHAFLIPNRIYLASTMHSKSQLVKP
jgi:hypothetical protein